MTDPGPWRLGGEELGLLRYVQPAQVAQHVPLPGKSGESRVARLRAVYDAIRQVRVGYADAAPGAPLGMQIIRPVEQVLWAPRHATCLDLALVFAAGCLQAGLHPVVVILDPPEQGGIGHAIVLVWLDRDTTPRADGHYADDVWSHAPTTLLDELQAALEGAGSLVAVDPNGLAVSLGTNTTPGVGVDLETAVSNGARYLTEHRWRHAVDVGSAWHTTGSAVTTVEHPSQEPLRAPYRHPDTAESPLRLLRAEYELTPFQSRDELVVLREWCQQIAAADRTGLAVITGIGGSGKTRLALELADRMRRDGWYSGVLPKGHAGVDWLGRVVSPVLVVLDYADARIKDSVKLLKALRTKPGPRAVVVLTARSDDGDWLNRITNSLDDDRHPYRREPIGLPDTHPDARHVYHRTVQRLTQDPVDPPAAPRGIRWTTLDFVLLGWIAAGGTPNLPASRSDLYDEALKHEVNYWVTTHQQHGAPNPDVDLLRTAAACLSLVSPPLNQAYKVLGAIDELDNDGAERREIARTMRSCLQPGPGEGLAVRPDPVGDHLLIRELGSNPDLVEKTITSAEESGFEQAVIALVRAGQDHPQTATRMINNLLATNNDRWRTVLTIAVTHQGAAEQALLASVRQTDCPLPLDQLSARLPFSPLGLVDLALAVDTRRLNQARSEQTSAGILPELLVRISGRESDFGDWAAALASITEAVEHYRQLAAANPATYLPNLAMSLNNLSNQQAGTGDRTAALASITEAVDIRRQLAAANPAAYLPDLAMSLNNLSVQQAGTGDRTAALASITEAVDIRRQLAAANPARYLPNLAGSLNNLSNQQAGAGDLAAALATVTEAVEHYRQLAAASAAVYLPDLAGSLNNLSNQQAGTGDRTAALASITEAVEHYRQLAAANPATYLPNLAMSLNNLSNQQAGTGDRTAALATITEAVDIRRQLAAANPAAHLPDLAGALNNLSACQADVGDRTAALASITEAVGFSRQLAAASPAAYLPDLAASLNTLSACQADVGDRTAALASITEAVEHYRQLGAANPAAYLPDLAMSLNNLSNQQAGTGDRTAALASITEAVDIRRRLAAANPAAHLSDLAGSLNNLSVWQSETGDRTAALTTATEAVNIRRGLAAANPAAHLPDLAGSLNNLCVRQSETGDRASALTSITEAVEHYRQLAAANPAAHLPDLASSLNNLSNQQSGAGDRAAALTTVTEAVEHYRQLAAANPAAYLPDLAMSLNNLSVQHSGAGDRAAALTTVTEAVEHYRQLAAANPAHLPNLAGSLNNLSNQQSGAGDRAAALTTVTEAVEHYRQLAAASPAAYLPNLAMSLNNLSVRQAETGDRAAALTTVTEAVEHYRQLAAANPAAHLPDLATSLNNLTDLANSQAADEWARSIQAVDSPYARAELRARYAATFNTAETAEVSRQQLEQAIREADQPIPTPAERTIAVLAQRARHTIRGIARDRGIAHAGHPPWVKAEVQEEHITLINDVGAASADLPVRLRQNAEILLSDEFRTSLNGIIGLYPTQTLPEYVDALLAEIAETSIDQTATRIEHDLTRRRALNEWIATTSWQASQEFFEQNSAILLDSDTKQLLVESQTPAALQHLAILDLVGRQGITEAFSAISNPAEAEHHALNAIEAGDTALLRAVVAASDGIRDRPIIVALALAIVNTENGEIEEALDAARLIADTAPPMQRRGHAVRLRNCQKARPDLRAGLLDVIAIIEPTAQH